MSKLAAVTRFTQTNSLMHANPDTYCRGDTPFTLSKLVDAFWPRLPVVKEVISFTAGKVLRMPDLVTTFERCYLLNSG